jgi:hypothetical protein
VPIETVANICEASEFAVQLTHPVREAFFVDLNHEVVVVGHQAVRQARPPVASGDALEEL